MSLDQPGLVDQRPRIEGAHHLGSAQDIGHDARLRDAAPEWRREVVAGADRDRQADGKPAQRGARGRQSTGDGLARREARQQPALQPEQAEQVIGEVGGLEIIDERRRRQAMVHQRLAGKPLDQIADGLMEPRGARLRRVIELPAHLRRHVAAVEIGAGPAAKLLRPHPLAKRRQAAIRAPVHPDEAGSDCPAGGVDRHGAVELAGDPDRGNIARTATRRCQSLRYRRRK